MKKLLNNKNTRYNLIIYLVVTVFCLVMQLIGAAFWIDIVVFCAGICAAAIATIPIKL